MTTEKIKKKLTVFFLPENGQKVGPLQGPVIMVMTVLTDHIF